MYGTGTEAEPEPPLLTPGELKAERLPGEFFRMLLRGRDDDAVMVWFAYLLNDVVVCGLLCSHEISAFAVCG